VKINTNDSISIKIRMNSKQSEQKITRKLKTKTREKKESKNIIEAEREKNNERNTITRHDRVQNGYTSSESEL